MDQASDTVDNKTGSNGKIVPVHEMKARWGFRGLAPLILNLRARHIEWRQYIIKNIGNCMVSQPKIKYCLLLPYLVHFRLV